MFILNCTSSFADLITSEFDEVPQIAIDDSNDEVMQWVLYAFKAKRKTCVIAMHVLSRYAILFVNVNKQNPIPFIKLFYERLANEMGFLCNIERDDQFQRMLDKMRHKHQKFSFCKRNSRSVQSHINDVVWHFRNQLDEVGHLPENNDDAYSFGCFVNQLLRKSSQDKNYFIPSERMKEFWLGAFIEANEKNKKSTSAMPLHAESNARANKNIIYLSDYKKK